MKSKRKEVPVKKRPGIYKQFYWCDASSSWKPTGRFRSVRFIQIGDTSKKEQAFFANIVDAIKFRAISGKLSPADESMIAEDSESKGAYHFKDLVEDWKRDHFALIELSTRQTYEKMLPTLDFLTDYPVASIDMKVLNSLAHFWVNDLPRSFRRKSFEKEWQLVRVILRFYKEEVEEGASYSLPSFRKLKKRTVLVPTIDGDVKYLDSEEATRFLQELKKRNDTYFVAGLLQYFFALRIGEVCGLYKDCIDLEKMVITIRRCVHWDLRTWIPTVKAYTKTKRVRFLPIPQQLAPILRQVIAQSDPKDPLLLSKDGTPLNRKTIASFYNRTLAGLGFNHVSGTHFMRRTAATLANEATGDIDAVSRFLGHSSVRVTRRYTGETDEQKLKVSRALGEVFRGDGGADKMFGTKSIPQNPATEKSVRKLRLVSDG